MSTGLTSASAQVTNANVTTLTTATLLNTNTVTTNVSSGTLNLSTGLTSASAQITNLNATSSTVATLLNTNTITTNVSSGTLNLSTGLTSASIQVTNLNGTTGTIGTLLNTNIVTTNVSGATLNLSSGLTTGTILATTSISSGLINATNSTVTNIVSTNLSTGTISLTNLSSTNATISNLVANGNSNTMGAIITTGGNVGIGTVSPGEILDVRGNLRVGNSTQANYIAFSGTFNDSPGSYNHTYVGERIYSSGTENSELFLFKGNDITDRIRLLSGEIGFDTFSGTVSGTFDGVGTSGARRLTIANGGNVGIGTTSPSFTLEVVGTGCISTSLTTGAVNSTNITATNIVSTNLSTGTIALTNLTSTNATITNILNTNISSSTLALSTGLTSASAQVTNLNVTTSTIATLLNTNIITTNISSGTLTLSTGLTSGNAQITNINSTNITVGTLNITNLVTTNISSATLTLSTGLTTASLQVTNENSTTSTIGTLLNTSNLIAIGNSNTLGNIFTTGGNVGIGTSSPVHSLTVKGTNVSSSIIANDESQTVTLFLGTPWQGNPSNGLKTALIAQGKTTFSKARLHFCLDDTGVNSTANNASLSNSRMMIDSNGNVGIANTSPANTLDVTGTGRITTSLTTGALYATNITSTNKVATNISSGTLNLSTGLTTGTLLATTNISSGLVNASNITATNIVSTNFSTGTISLTNLSSTNATISNLVATGNSNTVGAIITTGGNIGMGTASPGERLDVRGNLRIGSSTQGNYMAFYGTFNESPGSYNSTYIGERIYASTENSELLLFKGNDAGGGSGPDRIRLLAAQIDFETYTSALNGTFEGVGTTGGSRRLTILNGGNVGIGTTGPSYLLELASDSAAKPSTNTWTVSSDSRLKTNIELANLDTCYNNVKSIPLKRYTWRDDVYTNDQVSDRSKLGWIAQDVETIFPKAVEQKEMFGFSDCRSLNSDQIIAALYGAVQKLITKVETLETQVANLQGN